MMVCWHVDDLKVSHVDPRENTRFGDWLSETYNVTAVAHQGAVHDYLGMIFKFSLKEKVMINMIVYLLLTHGAHIHKACCSALAYDIPQNLFTPLLKCK
jgi:hypothetical protein